MSLFGFLLAFSLSYFQIALIGCDSITHRALNFIPNSELHCKKWDSPSIAPTKVANQKDDFSPPVPQMENFKNGFLKANCSRNPLDHDPEAYCIFINPKVNQGMGMVIISKESFFEASLQKLDFSEELPLPVPSPIKIVKMPEKGGAGVIASQDLKRGQPVAKLRAVGLFPNNRSLWLSDFGKRFRLQAIELLPIRTQNVIASLLADGRKERKVDFMASVLQRNAFATHLSPDVPIIYSALVLEPVVRFNHDCRANIGYFMDHSTQTLHMAALRHISAGEELTINYQSAEITRKVRQDSLWMHYGFRCTCSHCQMNAEQGRKSDESVTRVFQLQETHHMGDEWLSIAEVKELISICEQEFLTYSLINAYYIAAQVYNAHGRTEDAVYFAKKAKEDGLTFVGPKWQYLEGAEILIESPEEHESYLNIIEEDLDLRVNTVKQISQL